MRTKGGGAGSFIFLRKMITSYRRYLAWGLFVLVPLVLAMIILVPYFLTAPKVQPANIGVTGCKPVILQKNVLRLLTLNIAHGRSESFHQTLLSSDTIKTNLKKIADLLIRSKADVVALQECDFKSSWSGNLNQASFLAGLSGFSSWALATHVKGLSLEYGTGILSTFSISNGVSLTFDAEMASPGKGAAIVTVNLTPEKQVTITSIHLDFMSGNRRNRQATQLIELLKSRGGPNIIMGDFNGQWTDNESSVKKIAAALDLATFERGNNNIITFPGLKKRIDWILIPETWTIKSQKVLPDRVSDHRAVITVVEMDGKGYLKNNEEIKLQASGKIMKHCNDRQVVK